LARPGNIIKATVGLLAPDKNTSRLTFTKFDGGKLAEAIADGNTSLPSSAVQSISLKVNPEEISFDKPKIIQKVQTSAPGRFVVFDWGTDLTTISIVGNTGNMLPGIVQSGFNPFEGMVTDFVAQISPSAAATAKSPISGEAQSVAQQVMFDTLSYTEMLQLSPKYRAFKRLEFLYEICDTDDDVLVLEMDENIYRGYFFEFSFTMVANMPWNWKYNIIFVAINDLSVFTRRGDDAFPAIDGERII
jgi:hypothetical protein